MIGYQTYIGRIKLGAFMARPSKFNEKMIDQIKYGYSIGLSKAGIARLCRVSNLTLYNWLNKAAETENEENPDPQFVKLREAIQQGRIAFEEEMVNQIRTIGAEQRQYKAFSYLLEKRGGDQWKDIPRTKLISDFVTAFVNYVDREFGEGETPNNVRRMLRYFLESNSMKTLVEELDLEGAM